MGYRNAWGEEGTYAEVFAATASRMNTDILVDELCYFIFEEDLLRWILKVIPEKFKKDYASAINDATKYWVECHMIEDDEDD